MYIFLLKKVVNMCIIVICCLHISQDRYCECSYFYQRVFCCLCLFFFVGIKENLKHVHIFNFICKQKQHQNVRTAVRWVHVIWMKPELNLSSQIWVLMRFLKHQRWSRDVLSSDSSLEFRWAGRFLRNLYIKYHELQIKRPTFVFFRLQYWIECQNRKWKERNSFQYLSRRSCDSLAYEGWVNHNHIGSHISHNATHSSTLSALFFQTVHPSSVTLALAFLLLCCSEWLVLSC